MRVFHLKLRCSLSTVKRMLQYNRTRWHNAISGNKTWNAFVCKITFKPPSDSCSEQREKREQSAWVAGVASFHAGIKGPWLLPAYCAVLHAVASRNRISYVKGTARLSPAVVVVGDDNNDVETGSFTGIPPVAPESANPRGFFALFVRPSQCKSIWNSEFRTMRRGERISRVPKVSFVKDERNSSCRRSLMIWRRKILMSLVHFAHITV